MDDPDSDIIELRILKLSDIANIKDMSEVLIRKKIMWEKFVQQVRTK